MERDFQRQRVYDAEIMIWGKWPPPAHYRTLEECQTLVDRICEATNYKGTAIIILPGNNSSRAFARPMAKEMVIPKEFRNTLVICHEIAHLFVPADKRIAAPHGEDFCRRYIDITRLAVGNWWANLLRISFHIYGVEVARERREILQQR